jgi:hypothetical protein
LVAYQLCVQLVCEVAVLTHELWMRGEG